MDLTMDGELLVENLKNELRQNIPSILFDTYIQDLKFSSISGNHLTLIHTNSYCRDLVINKYSNLIIDKLGSLTNRIFTFSIILSSSENEEIQSQYTKQEEQKSNEEEIDYSKQLLNPKYTFETFVVGNNNRFAHAAALAVADNPAKTYNPLFIYGGVGLGKTHLMHAIGNRILQNNKQMNIVYVTSETFTNHLINTIRDGKNNDLFRNKYRNADALLIDDIQFIAKKERVQEEFFHTFNTLYENGKQIIISSDKHPNDIPFLEDRLKSRFEWGLPADISNPDYETRVAILRKKTLDEGIIIDDSIIADIAAKIDSNVRELEGVFNKIVARASLTHSQISIELAESVINEFISKKDKVISSEYIQETVAKYFNIDKKDFAGDKRSNDIAFPRQIAMYLCREIANMSFPQIGIDFGNRDHSTVMHAYKKIAKDIKDKTNTKLIVESVKNIVLNNE